MAIQTALGGEIAPPATAPGARASPGRGLVARLLADRLGRAGVILAGVVLAGVILGPLVVRADPTALHPDRALAPPSRAHPLGTDEYGRDELARLIDGGRRSLAAAAAILGLGMAIGIALGVAAGMGGRPLDALVGRAIDVVLALPDLVVVLAVLGVLGPGFGNLVLALTVPTAAFVARLARGCVRGVDRSPVVMAARCAGVARSRIALGHVVPEVVGQILVVMTMNVGMVLVGIAGFSFLGLGVQQPTPEWGAMLADARLYMGGAPWLVAAPAAAILLALVAANLIADALVRLGAVHA
ncbi:MAG TPA: ABC transporter permease [Actinomycetota bacterium]|nr:ABC transporter permease [Actinomycetota bacterium]